jgi:hypothetical protein
MPVEAGLDFIKNRFNLGCKIKFRALMSADWTESDLQHAQKIGCKVFHKLFDLEELLEWLKNCQKQIDQNRVLSDWSVKEDIIIFQVANNTSLIDAINENSFSNSQRIGVDICSSCLRPEKVWTGRVAVGSKAFIEDAKAHLSFRAKGRNVIEAGEGYQLREKLFSYKALFGVENEDIDLKNT